MKYYIFVLVNRKMPCNNTTFFREKHCKVIKFRHNIEYNGKKN